MRVSFVHEGKKSTYINEEGREHLTEFEQISASYEISNEEVEKIDIDGVKEKILVVAEAFIAQQFKQFRYVLDKTLAEAGQVVDGKNMTFRQSFLALLEKVQLDFDHNNRPLMSQLVMSPGTAEKYRAEMEKLECDPEFIKEFEALMIKKRNEWHDREACRKLVD
ncbi:MAG: hypothetical protein HS116_01305 [Planctomycetes bacterium]|nr:hypothetical protein [Planctomycetota bacterium]